MVAFQNAAKALLLATVLVAGSAPVAVAQAQTATLVGERVYSETFDGADQ